MGEVFTDVFARWATGQLRSPDPTFDDDDDDGEDPYDGDIEVTEEFLESLSRKQLRFVAGELGIRTRKKPSGKQRSRRRLIELILGELDND
jgi:hypothetical protein